MTLRRRRQVAISSPAREEPDEAGHSNEDRKDAVEVVPAQPTSARAFCPSGFVGRMVSLVLMCCLVMGFWVWHLHQEKHGFRKQLATSENRRAALDNRVAALENRLAALEKRSTALEHMLADSGAQQQASAKVLGALKQSASCPENKVENVANPEERVVLALEPESRIKLRDVIYSLVEKYHPALPHKVS